MTGAKMEFSSLEKFTRISASCIKDDWRKSFDSLFTALRVHFVFDNLAIYKLDHPGGVVEAVYARATGRGRSQEADASWGEEIANQVISSGTVMCSSPGKANQSDRIAMPYLLGLPLAMTSGQGALVFVRFGGPEFSTEHSSWALLAASHVIRIFEHRALKDALDQLEQARHRYQLQ